MATEDEERIALEIMQTVRRLQLPFKLDQITEGRGNCFPLAIQAQCRRPEITKELSQIQKKIIDHSPTFLRRAVHDFISNSTHATVREYIRTYEEIIATMDDKTWEEYWEAMNRNYEWVDYIFIQSTAWFLSHDILIITTTSTEESPYITISGNLVNEQVPCEGVPLLIGSKSNVHYQSLLPISRHKTRAQIIQLS